MMNRKKTLLLMLMLLLMFTGCAQINIDTGVDKDYNAYLTYTIDADLTSLDSEQAQSTMNTLDDVMEHYKKELEFEVLKSKSDLLQGICSYELVKKVPNNSYEEAFNTLQNMLTDEAITPFMQVAMTSKLAEYQQLYSFKGELDFATIYKTTNIESFPQYLQDDIGQKFEGCAGTITLSLPGSEVETASGGETIINNEQITLSGPFEFEQKATVELSTRLNVANGKPLNGSMDRIIQDINSGMRSWMIIGAIAFVAIVLGIALHLRRGKNRKANNKNNETVV